MVNYESALLVYLLLIVLFEHFKIKKTNRCGIICKVESLFENVKGFNNIYTNKNF